jgi:hypothetical protein
MFRISSNSLAGLHGPTVYSNGSNWGFHFLPPADANGKNDFELEASWEVGALLIALPLGMQYPCHSNLKAVDLWVRVAAHIIDPERSQWGRGNRTAKRYA